MTRQPEGKLSFDIQRALKMMGAYVWKVHGNEFTPAGTPDIVGVYRGQFIAIETKMPGNDLSAVQRYRIARMRTAGALVCAPCYTVAAAIEMIDAIDLEMTLRIASTVAAIEEWGQAKHQLSQKYGSGADREG